MAHLVGNNIKHSVAAITLLAVIVMVCGCATVYQPQLDGPKAKIRFVAHVPLPVKVAVMQDEYCGTSGGAGRVVVVGGGSLLSHEHHAIKHQRIGMLGAENIDLELMHEIDIPAEKTYVYQLGFRGYSHVCDLTLAFEPKENAQYETVLYYDEGGSCKATLNRMVSVQGGALKFVREPSFRKPKQCGYPAEF